MDMYEKLRQILHAHPTGAPKTDSFDQILRILFTPEEVKVALGMGFAPRSIERIAAEAGVEPAEAGERCESMADKGIIFGREKRGEMGYALLPTIPGVFEFPFMAGGGTPAHERLAKLWQEYHHQALGNEFAGSQTPFTRVIPVEETLDLTVEVLPYEEVCRMLDDVDTFALGHCACRVSVGACDKPRQVCLIFGATGEFLISRGLAERTTRDRAQEVLRESEEAGLVHTTNNSQDRLNFVCNCCGCCCTLLRGITQLNNPRAIAKSRWQAEVDAELCTGCGLCEDERCQIGAITLVDGLAQVVEGRCIGCGLCVSGCPDEALSMALRPEAVPAPPETVIAMGLTIASEKGRLEEFLGLMQR